MAQVIYVSLIYDFGVTFSAHSHQYCILIVTNFVSLCWLLSCPEFQSSFFQNFVLVSNFCIYWSCLLLIAQTMLWNIQVIFHIFFFTSLMQPFLLGLAIELTFFVMTQSQGVAVSPESLIEASSSVFVAVTFALLGFYNSSTIGFAMQCVLLIYITVCIYLFSAVLFCCSVLWGSSLITYQ